MANGTKVASNRLVYYEELDVTAAPYDVSLTAVLFSQAFNTFAKALEKAVQPAAITVSQYVTLWALLLSERPMTPTEISRLLPIETHSVSALLNQLHKRKLIGRRRSASDRRSVKVTLTAEGEQLTKESSRAVHEMMADVFGSLSSGEMPLFDGMLRKIRNTSVAWLGANPDRVETTLKRLVPRFEGVGSERQVAERIPEQAVEG